MFKRTVVRSVRPDAERRVHKGEAQRRYRLDGAAIWVKALEGDKVLVPSSCWYARVGGKLKKLARDKAASQLMLADMLRHTERVSAGIELPRRADRDNIAEIVEKYLRAKVDAGVKAPRIAALRQRIGGFIKHLGVDGGSFQKLKQALTPEAIDKYTESLTGTSATRLSYVVAIRGLLRWLEAEGYIGKVAAPRRPKVRVERGRRAFTVEELGRLFKAAPPLRSLFYRLSTATLSRKSALLATVAADYDLDAPGGAVLHLRAENSKTDTDQIVPVPAELVAELRALIAATKTGKPVFAGTALEASTNTFRRDLKKAGIALETRDGRAVLHGLRHSGASLLVRAGVSLLVIQKLGGWKTMSMLQTYAHVEPNDARGLITGVVGPLVGAHHQVLTT